MGTLSWRGQETGCLEANHTEAQVLQENSQQQPQTNTFPDLTQGVSILSESVLALYNDKGVILNNRSNLIIWVKICHASPFVHLLPKSLCLCISAYKHTIHKNA